MENPVKPNEEEIIFLTFSLRKTEIERRAEKKQPALKMLLARRDSIRLSLDKLLNQYVVYKQWTSENPYPPEEAKSDKDIGPADVLKSLHEFAERKASQVEVVNALQEDVVSVAGQTSNILYVIHFEMTKYEKKIE